MIWEPFLLALVLGLVVSAGLYFAYLWPSVEPLEEEAAPARAAAALGNLAAASPGTAASPAAAAATPTPPAEPAPPEEVAPPEPEPAPAAGDASEAPAEGASGKGAAT